MESRIEIILEVNNIKYYLETQGIESIPLTLNVADIKDITTTKGSFSKTIKVPETTHNRTVFNNITDLNSVSDFDVNIKQRAYILVDSVLIIDGYFQLKDFKIDKNTYTNELSLVIYADNTDFFLKLGDSYLEDLDLSEYNHIWNAENITNSWTASYTNGYYYPLIDYGKDWTVNSINGSNYLSFTATGGVEVKDLFPALYTRVIFDKIFKSVGYNYTTNTLFTEIPFNDLIIPTITNQLTNTRDFVDANSFQVSLTQSQYIYGSHSYNFFKPNTSYNSGQPFGDINSVLNTDTKRIEFNDESYPNFDDNNLYNTTLFEYTNNLTYSVSQKFNFDLSINQLFYYSQTQPPTIQVKRSYNPILGPIGGTVSGGYNVVSSDKYPTNSALPVDTISTNIWTRTTSAPFGKLNQFETLDGKFSTEELIIYPGEKVWIEYNFLFNGKGDYTIQNTSNTFEITSGATISSINLNSGMWNTINSNVSPGQMFDINQIIPKKIKQRDFIQSLIKMFNLIVEPSKEYPFTLNIDTRDYYYENGIKKDWSDKIDLNDQIEVSILSDEQNRRTIFKYKDDKDYYNTLYLNTNRESYGQYLHDNENQFLKNEKILEVLFSPTPLVSVLNYDRVIGSTASTIIIPKIGVENNGKLTYSESNIRILLKNYITGLNSKDYWKFNSTTQTGYPYAGHFNDPNNQTFDLNFGQTKGLYYPNRRFTNNNLFNEYWFQTISEINDSDSRVINTSMYLTPTDISTFKFSDNIFLDFGDGGQYYKVNKIDYDPTLIKTCKVQLFKTKYISVGRNSTYDLRNVEVQPDVFRTNNSDNSNTNNSPDTAIYGLNNNNNDSSVVIVGNENNVSNQNSFVVGDYNNSSSYNASITGNENTIEAGATNSVIIGNNNHTNTGTNDTILIGFDNTISTVNGSTNSIEKTIIIGQSGVVYESNIVNISGIMTLTNNYITANRDEILNPFNDNSIINYISGSRDAIRNLGSFVNYNIISGGRDNIL